MKLYIQDPAQWLRRKGLPQFGYNLVQYRNSYWRILVGTYPSKREAEQALARCSKQERAYV